ncbi:hypothetical protein PG993_000584 [Apiospora rasikravindrae]|uniref:Peptidase C14 caspase domain-containing protein n=1 Tax=Apiospora rasikravindrae TaxID=990691 RepID=A0ABR1U9H4_9PEZI
MAKNGVSITHHAILIGIDAYPTKPLKSCVRDAEGVKTQVETILKESVNVEMLTTSQNNEGPENTAAKLPIRPTRENVVSAFEGVLARAKAGDFLYIHFSGHGTRKPPQGPFSNTSLGDLALVLLDEHRKDGVTYLYGPDLAAYLKSMVDAGLVITLVLDCCFSASVYRRDDPAVRYLPYDVTADPGYITGSLAITKERSQPHRDASMRPNWLVDPDRYVIITACGLTEEVVGAKFDGQNHGALSYFLSMAMGSVGLTRRHKDIYDFVRARLQSSGLPQNPVLYGNENQGFFGQVDSYITSVTIPVIARNDQTLILQAGDAHGIKTGDQFLLVAPGSSETDPRAQGHSSVAQVTHTRGLTSDLEQLDKSIRVRTGWKAMVLTRLSLKKFPVRLQSGIERHERLLIALEERSICVQTPATDEPCDFIVTMNEAEEYDILDESGGRMMNLLPIPQGPTDIGHIAAVLEHLCRFRLVRELSTGAPAFRETFEISLFSNGQKFEHSSLIELNDRDLVNLVVTNKGEKALYMFVYDLGPSWQVENACKATYKAILSQNHQSRLKRTDGMKLKVQIPPNMKEKGNRSCQDIIKVFITSRPTSFSLLELPRLSERTVMRSPERSSPVEEGLPEDWAAISFPIRISQVTNIK